MTLEACMLVLDNSSYSINGDYPPNRLSAQADAVHIIFNRKINANPENEVGLMVMGGKAPEVLVTPTKEEGQLVAALHSAKQGGTADLSTGIQVAQLALKHRQNKNQRQRIIVFVGSPLSESTAALVKLGKKMKKNNVAIDIISFGTDTSDPLAFLSLPSSSSSTEESAVPETNESKLLALHEAVNSSDNSHFLAVEPGPHLLSERIMNSAILRGDAGEDDGMGGGGGGDEYGVDPNLDPELALALRMSLEEERARQASSTAATSGTPHLGAALPTVDESIPSTPIKKQVSFEDVGMEDEDEEMKKALALSRGDDVEMEEAVGGEEEDDEEAEIARAIALSMKEDAEEE